MTTGGIDSDWRLRDERDLLRRSLEDAAREHGAGDLADEDYALLKARDEQRLADVEAALAALGADAQARTSARRVDGALDGAHAAPQARRRLFGRRRWVAVAGAVLVAAGAVLLVMDLTTPRLPGQDATGSIDLNTVQRIHQQLQQATDLVKEGHDTRALELYGEVIAEDPRQPVALAEWGWLDWRAASRVKDQRAAAAGAAALEEAVKIDKYLFAAQFYLGSVLLEEGEPAKAVARFSQFLADGPTAAWRREAASAIRTAYTDAHRPVPSGVPAT